MNIRELRAELEGKPDDMRVIVCGYEGGYNDAEVTQAHINLDRNVDWMYGPHELSDADAADEVALLVGRAG